ncbi:MAG TPA: cytochrome c [Dongiaceae bacterium]|nr:cytochrome c [Dongiaceae bacterium]
MELRCPDARTSPSIIVSVLLLLTAVCFCYSIHAQTSPKPGEPLIQSVKGPELFRAYCASCHGATAHGDGPVASNLKAKMPDLTVLTKTNKGKFPAAHVRDVIDGQQAIASHGSRAMPVWGPIFHQVENDQDFGEVRLQNLVKYLESIQQK